LSSSELFKSPVNNLGISQFNTETQKERATGM